MDNAAFRIAFPEFASTSAYPESLLTVWGTVADEMVIAERWANLATIAVQLYAAHFISLAKNNTLTATASGVPGSVKGVQTMKKIDKVQVGYDASIGTEDGAGQWNLTTYGRQLMSLSNMIGAGCVQL